MTTEATSQLVQTADARRRVRVRRTGQVMVGIAIVGAVVSILAMVVGWVLLGDINQASENTITVTFESLDVAEDTVELADGVLGSTSETVDTLENTITSVAASSETATGVVDSIGSLSDSAGTAFGDAEATVRELSEIGDTIDDVLAAISRLPLAPDYKPTARFGETLGDLANALEPLPTEFENTTTELAAFSLRTEEVQADLEELAESVAVIGDRLDERERLVDTYRGNIASARALGLATADDLDRNLRFARILTIVAGINFALAQIVPFSYGRLLLNRSREQEPSMAR